jgi:hypothetical protein
MRDYALHAFLLGVSCSIVIGLLVADHVFDAAPGKGTFDADRTVVAPAGPGPSPEPPLLRDGAERSDGEPAKPGPEKPAPEKPGPEPATSERGPPDAKPPPGEAAQAPSLRRDGDERTDGEPAKSRSDVATGERGPAPDASGEAPPPTEREAVEGKPDRRPESAEAPRPPRPALKQRATPRQRIEPLTRRAASASARRSSHFVLPWLRTLRRSAPSAAPRRC